MKITNPWIKDQKNIEWLENNFETFINHMALKHSVHDIAHTILCPDTLNDAYVTKLIKEVERSDRQYKRECEERQKELKAEKVKKSSGDKKAQEFEKVLEAKQRENDEDYELPD